jgi:hypothetical protein
MAANFPNTPFLYETFFDPVSSVTYLWDGSAWTGTNPGGVIVVEQVWSQSAQGIYTSRRVGINTNYPYYQLDVFGSTRVVGLITAKSLHLDYDLSVTGVATFNGVVNAGDLRIRSVGEKLTKGTGNLVKLSYKEGSGNIGFCTSPTGDITLEVTGIPTDSSFDNQVLTFSVVVQQTGIARTCNRVKLNGVLTSIKWPEGIVGVGNTNCIDIFNFTGINTIGSASSAANYTVLGFVNGDFR